MANKVFSKDAWLEALGGLKEHYRVFLPLKDGDFFTYKPIEEAKKIHFDYDNTRLSPKGLIFPQSERMFEFSLDTQDPEANILKEAPKDDSPRAIVGVRPCDAHAVGLVRRNFDNPEYRDPWWVKHVEAATYVGLGCNAPCATCFCKSVGGGPFNEEGLDAMMVDLGDRFLVRALTEKGEEFLSRVQGGEAADEEVLKEARELAQKVTDEMPDTVPTGRLKDLPVMALFEAPFWEEVAFACLNCGTCNYLCPTCWCFDIQDEVYKTEGIRLRNWDSCMFPLFTLHGSGHNPRDQKFQRVRQRFMHKLKYYVDKYGDGVQCSGCGRCVQFCPVNIDIRRVCGLMDAYEPGA
ncbi:MAG: 4Fe-4S ferredoxin [Deltaproteobacteria bacterium]|nr:MAG: 4Fe-4S ferredoxin [Deltaproteobacteria bacterium]